MQVVQKGRYVLFTEVVIAPARHENGVVRWQIAHRVAESRTRGVATVFYVHKFAVHNLAVYSDRLEVAQLVVEELTVLSPASKVVKSLLNQIALQDCYWVVGVYLANHSALFGLSLPRRND